jgi:hypothetical protein
VTLGLAQQLLPVFYHDLMMVPSVFVVAVTIFFPFGSLFVKPTTSNENVKRVAADGKSFTTFLMVGIFYFYPQCNIQ